MPNKKKRFLALTLLRTVHDDYVDECFGYLE